MVCGGRIVTPWLSIKWLSQVPPIGKGSLYIRPLLVGSGPILGLGPAPEYTFAIFAAAVGAYFKARQNGHNGDAMAFSFSEGVTLSKAVCYTQYSWCPL